MATKIECACHKCGRDFDATADEFPLSEEGGFEIRAQCPACGVYVGHISVTLAVKEPDHA